MTLRSFFQRQIRRVRGGLDLDWVTDELAIGCLPKASEIHRFAAAGISGMLCLIEKSPPYEHVAAELGMEVRHIPLIDWAAPSEAQFDAAISALSDLHQPGRKVFVHCRAGIGRAVLVTIAFLCRQGFSLEQAETLVRSTRRVAAPNRRQLAALRAYCERFEAS